MEVKGIAKGVWPTMITPYTEDGKIDYAMVENLVEWYIERGVAGIFAVCQSSEMFFLTEDERVELASFIVKQVNGRVGVIASGHVADDLEDQIRGIYRMAETGVQSVVLLPNRFAKPDEGDDVMLKNLDYVLNKVDGVMFGFYECPAPYKRLLSPETVAYCADTGRFSFLKDTCCDAEMVAKKIQAGRGVVGIYNANCAQLLLTLRAGAAGFSGVMANFYPELYVWLCNNFETQPELAERVQNFLGIASCLESRAYPVCAKKYIQNYHFPQMSDFCRSVDRARLISSFKTEIEQMHALYMELLPSWGIQFPFKV